MSVSTISTSARTAVYQSVSRTRTESSMALPGGRSCLGARLWRNTFVCRVRDIRIDLRAKEVAGSAAGMEQGLAGIGVNFPAHAIHVNFNQIREGIERLIPDELGDGNFSGAELTGAAQQRTKTREQLAEFERLGEVSVSAVIEAGDAVLHGIACSQHQDGHALS